MQPIRTAEPHITSSTPPQDNQMDVTSGSEPQPLSDVPPTIHSPSSKPPSISHQSGSNSPTPSIPIPSVDCNDGGNSDVDRHFGDDNDYEMQDLHAPNFPPPHEASLFSPTSSPACLSSPSPSPDSILPIAPAEGDEEPSQPASIPNTVMSEPRQLLNVYQTSHPLWFVQITMLLVALLHTRHHLSFHACLLTLFCLSVIFLALQVVPASNPLPIQLPTILRKLELDDKFIIHPICPTCHHIFDPHVSIKTICLISGPTQQW
jgi:hypothetical protein